MYILRDYKLSCYRESECLNADYIVVHRVTILIYCSIFCSPSQGPKPKYACVVSVGCGIYPPEKMENAEKVLLGLHWLNPLRLKEKIKIAVKLMCSAVSLYFDIENWAELHY